MKQHVLNFKHYVLNEKIGDDDPEFKHISQPTGHSCGPTCMKMVHDYFVGDSFQIDEICKACGTDWVVGTPPDKFIKGLDWMGIEYEHHVGMEKPYDFLRNVFSKGNIAIVRTITQGIPHWIVVRSWDEDSNVFTVNDPWLGPKKYSEEELEEVWVPRDHEFFEVSGAKQMISPKKETSESNIGPFNNKEEIIEAMKLAVPIFSKQMDPKSLVSYLAAKTDWHLSARASVGDKTVGFYFLTKSNITDALSPYCDKEISTDKEEDSKCEIYIDLNKYANEKGLEGIALGVNPEYKGMGIGKKLIEYSQGLGFDYIWGMQYESLGNLKHWLKRRELAAVTPGLFYTIQDLNVNK